MRSVDKSVYAAYCYWRGFGVLGDRLAYSDHTSCGYAGALRIAYCVSEGRLCVLLRMAYGVLRIRIADSGPVGGSAYGVWRMRMAYCRPVGGSAYGVWRMAYWARSCSS